MRYILNKRLMSVDENRMPGEGDSLVEVLTKETYKERYNMLIPNHLLLRSMENIQYCKAELLTGCIIGTFLIPDKADLLGKELSFGYYMDREKLVFIDESGIVGKILHEIEKVQILEKTYVVHLFFEFLEYLVHDEVQYLQAFEEKLTDIEDRIMEREMEKENVPAVILKCRKELLKLNSYYNQLLDMSETLDENYNGLLNEEDCRLFRMFGDRISRLVGNTQNLREYSLQIREMYQTQVDIKQNRVMQFLTVVTTIFMPLTLIAGWYGMNFKNMPELDWDFGYLLIAGISLLIIVIEIWYFKKNNWLKK